MTGDRLGPAAVTLAGVMARGFGWRPDEFWAATPADVAAVLLIEQGESEGVDGARLAAMMEACPDG